MRRAPKVAVTVALVSLVWGQGVWRFALADSEKTDFSAKTTGAASVEETSHREIKEAVEVPSLDQRLASFDNRLSNVCEEGRLTSEKAENYRSALSKISEDKSEQLAYTGKLNGYDEHRLQLLLDNLDKQLLSDLTDRKIATPDIAARLAELRRNVAIATSEGRLSQTEVRELTEALSHWHVKESLLLNDANLSYMDSLVLSMHLDRFSDRLSRVLQQRPVVLPDFKQLFADSSKCIEDNQSRLKPEIFSAFRKRIDEDKSALAATLAKPESALRTQQILSIAAELQRLQDRIALLATGKTMAVPLQERETQIDQKIADDVFSGILSPNEGHRYKAELEAIIAEHKNGSEEVSAAFDKPERVALELERLASSIAQSEHAPRLPWTGLVAYHAALDKRIEDACKAGRITQEQAKEYQEASDALNKKAEGFRSSGGRFDSAEILEIAISLQSVGVELHHAMKDRAIKAPENAELQNKLDKLIADGIESGRLAADDNITARLSHIEALQSQYEKSSEGLDLRAKLAVAIAIQHLIAEIQGQIHRNDLTPPISLDARLSQLGQDISTSMARGLLSVERAGQYKSALDTIYGELWRDRKKAAGMSAADGLAVASDVAILQQQLSDEIREKSTLPRQLVPRYRAIVLEIGRALAVGRISPSEADALLGKLNQTAWSHVEAASSQGGISHGEGLHIAYDLEKISGELQGALRDEQLPIPNISNKALRLDSRLASSLASGRMSIQQAQRLEESLESVLSFNSFLASSGGLSHPEALTIAAELDRVSGEIDSAESAQCHWAGLTLKRAELEKRVKDAVASGKLSVKDANIIKYDLDRIADSEAAFRISDEGLNFAEALTLAQNLERVAGRLNNLPKAQLSLKSKTQK